MSVSASRVPLKVLARKQYVNERRHAAPVALQRHHNAAIRIGKRRREKARGRCFVLSPERLGGGDNPVHKQLCLASGLAQLDECRIFLRCSSVYIIWCCNSSGLVRSFGKTEPKRFVHFRHYTKCVNLSERAGPLTPGRPKFLHNRNARLSEAHAPHPW
jgi:hypothetical protein